MIPASNNLLISVLIASRSQSQFYKDRAILINLAFFVKSISETKDLRQLNFEALFNNIL